MPYTGNEDHKISLADAAKLTKNYRDGAGTGAVLGSYFSKSGISTVLNQTGCIGLRIYYAKTEVGAAKLVIAGVNSDGDDIDTGELAEFSNDCPPFCSKANDLNS